MFASAPFGHYFVISASVSITVEYTPIFDSLTYDVSIYNKSTNWTFAPHYIILQISCITIM